MVFNTDDFQPLSLFGNVASFGTIVSTIFGWLPPIAAAVALLWYFIQIYESTTVQTWLRARRDRKIARMKAAVIMLEAQNKQPETPLDALSGPSARTDSRT